MLSYYAVKCVMTLNRRKVISKLNVFLDINIDPFYIDGKVDKLKTPLLHVMIVMFSFL